MLRRSLSIVLIIALMMETGCAKRVPVDVHPVRRPSDRVKPEDKVSVVLREEMTLRGTTAVDSLNQKQVEWKTLEITGELVTWDEQKVTVHVINYTLGENAVFEVPLEQIEQVDRWPTFKPGPTLAAIGGLALVVGVTFLIVVLISKP